MKVIVEDSRKVVSFGDLELGDVFQFCDGSKGIWMAMEDFGQEESVANAVRLDKYDSMVVDCDREVYLAKSATLKAEF